jgi:MFS family permease
MKYSKAFAYLIAAHVNSIGLILGSYWLGGWLNKNWPVSFSWLLITIPLGVLAIGHSFYLIVKTLIRISKDDD